WLGRRRIGKAAFAAAVLYLTLLLPALGFIEIRSLRYSWVADHLQYLAAAIPIAGLTAYAWRYLSANLPLARIVGAAVVLLCGGLAFRQTRSYRDSQTLWTDTLERNSDSFLAHDSLGMLLLAQDRVDEAQNHFEEAFRLNPHFALALSHLASIEMKRRNWPRA